MNIKYRKSLLISCFVLVFIELITVILSLIFLWHERYLWLDNWLHIGGGVFIGLYSLYLLHGRLKIEKIKNSRIFIILFSTLSALAIGILWEIFEISVDTVTFALGGSLIHADTFLDSFTDLISDIIGGIMAGIIYISLWQRN